MKISGIICLPVICMAKFNRREHFSQHHRAKPFHRQATIERAGSSVDDAVRHDYYMHRLVGMLKHLQSSNDYKDSGERKRVFRLMMQTYLSAQKISHNHA